MKFDDPDQWPADKWSRFLEILRAFCLSDAEQDEYFPELQEPYFYSSIGSDDITLCSYSPALANGHNLSMNFYGICEEEDEEMFTRLAALFYGSFEAIVSSCNSSMASKPSETDPELIAEMRPKLRALCGDALDLFGAQNRAPVMKWEEIAPR